MPFKSQSQRALFYAALKGKEVRSRLGMSLAAIRKAIEHDTGGKLPKKARR